MDSSLLNQFLTLFVVLDPIGVVPLFLALTKNYTEAKKRQIALRAVVVAGGVLIAFIVGGQALFAALGIRLLSFKIAGGIVLFLFGLQMIFDKPESERMTTEADHDVAIFPMAVPAIAGPGSMLAVIVLTNTDQFTVSERAVTMGMLVVVLGITYGILWLATPIQRILGSTGASIISRVMGVILCGFATESVVSAFLALRS